jgi:hypothetical protein
MSRSVSSRFLSEATNQRWSRFLHEATGETGRRLALVRSHLFNNDVYQKRPLFVQDSDRLDGDQVALFYCFRSLDHSETSMLVSAGFERHRPVNN